MKSLIRRSIPDIHDDHQLVGQLWEVAGGLENDVKGEQGVQRVGQTGEASILW